MVLCPKCGFLIKKFFDVHLIKCDGRGPSRSRRHQGLGIGHSWNKGRTNEQIYGFDRAKIISSRISQGNIGSSGRCENEEDECLRRQKISNTAKINGLSGGYRRNAGRGRRGWYKNIWCDSSWELAWVIFNIEHNVKFERNTIRFEYEYEDKLHHYTPDFILDDSTLIEIKGFIDDKAKLKILSVPKNYHLTVLQKEEMKPILQYVRQKYGKDFIRLYGRVSERFKEPVLKTGAADEAAVGSNPTSSAILL